MDKEILYVANVKLFDIQLQFSPRGLFLRPFSGHCSGIRRGLIIDHSLLGRSSFYKYYGDYFHFTVTAFCLKARNTENPFETR